MLHLANGKTLLVIAAINNIMSKDEILNLIFEKNNSKTPLTEEERAEALKYFREDEIRGLYMPKFNCMSCFSKRTSKFVTLVE